MSDEKETTESAASESEATIEAAKAPTEDAVSEVARKKERVDEDGLPLDRAPTIDDVRSQEARHSRIAVGCTLVIVLFIVLFWLIRGGFIG